MPLSAMQSLRGRGYALQPVGNAVMAMAVDNGCGDRRWPIFRVEGPQLGCVSVSVSGLVTRLGYQRGWPTESWRRHYTTSRSDGGTTPNGISNQEWCIRFG